MYELTFFISFSSVAAAACDSFATETPMARERTTRRALALGPASNTRNTDAERGRTPSLAHQHSGAIEIDEDDDPLHSDHVSRENWTFFCRRRRRRCLMWIPAEWAFWLWPPICGLFIILIWWPKGSTIELPNRHFCADAITNPNGMSLHEPQQRRQNGGSAGVQVSSEKEQNNKNWKRRSTIGTIVKVRDVVWSQ